jgi:hypothetical protein
MLRCGLMRVAIRRTERALWCHHQQQFFGSINARLTAAFACQAPGIWFDRSRFFSALKTKAYAVIFFHSCDDLIQIDFRFFHVFSPKAGARRRRDNRGPAVLMIENLASASRSRTRDSVSFGVLPCGSAIHAFAVSRFSAQG